MLQLKQRTSKCQEIVYDDAFNAILEKRVDRKKKSELAGRKQQMWLNV